MDKTKVEVLSDDHFGEFKKGERGYIDGYVRGGDDAPYAAVVIDDRVALISTTNLKVVTTEKEDPLREENEGYDENFKRY